MYGCDELLLIANGLVEHTVNQSKDLHARSPVSYMRRPLTRLNAQNRPKSSNPKRKTLNAEPRTQNPEP